MFTAISVTSDDGVQSVSNAGAHGRVGRPRQADHYWAIQETDRQTTRFPRTGDHPITVARALQAPAQQCRFYAETAGGHRPRIVAELAIGNPGKNGSYATAQAAPNRG